MRATEKDVKAYFEQARMMDCLSVTLLTRDCAVAIGDQSLTASEFVHGSYSGFPVMRADRPRGGRADDQGQIHGARQRFWVRQSFTALA